MKKSIAIFLLLTLHGNPIANDVVIIDFLLNKEYIKEFLCVNKDKPELACNGKCYLIKQLEETQNEGEQEFPDLIQFNVEFILTFHDVKETGRVVCWEKRRSIQSWNNNYTFQFMDDIFHPPTYSISQ